MAEQDLAQDILDSDKAFRETFDRASAAFHGGDTTAVPLGGSRVPESMAVRQHSRARGRAAPEDSAVDERVWSQAPAVASAPDIVKDLAAARVALTRLKRTLVRALSRQLRESEESTLPTLSPAHRAMRRKASTA